ncbi:hypothetical protein [Parafrankia sp. CH37]|nr:hypothetical protein [Parafrankia sp. CH37]
MLLTRTSDTDLLGRIALFAGAGLGYLSRLGVRAVAGRPLPLTVRRLPHQITLVRRCLVEVASLRAAKSQAPRCLVPVILTASEALHAMTGMLAGIDHLRIIHEVYTTEDAPVRLLGRLARRSGTRVLAVATTPAVRTDLARQFPDLATAVHPFTILLEKGAPDDRERHAARQHFGIAAHETVLAMVGGWWGHKDPRTVCDALALLTRETHLIVAGSPLDTDILDTFASLPHVHLHLLHRTLTTDQVRMVYAASNATVVSRLPGVGKESGLVMDAVRYGVPLIVSDNDPDLTAQLTDQPWARIFRASNPADLARQLDNLGTMPRPTRDAADLLGMRTADEQLNDLHRLHTAFTEGVRR